MRSEEKLGEIPVKSGDRQMTDRGQSLRGLGSLLKRRNLKDLLAVVVPVVIFSLAPHFYSNEILLISIMIYVALAEGVNIIYGFTGYLPFGYVGFYGVGAYATSLAILDFNLPPEVSIIVGGAISALVALVLMPLLRLKGSYFAIATLAAAEALYAIIGNPSLKSITQDRKSVV